VAAARARAHPLVPFAVAAYVAFIVHAGVDWDWEMPVVVLAALLCGVAIFAAARDEDEPGATSRVRFGLLAASCIAIVASFVGLVANVALSQADRAGRRGDWSAAVRDAKRAHSWAPWSSEPWQQRGEAELALGKTEAAAGDFRHAIAKNRRDWSLWFDLARA